ncbi:MAG TPA: chromate resistance protein ChrB domain-containing protein [Gemmatimonadales bacterium]|nr:chromate resistance protein ChrB domain-containing protein [Gemmatimonadales bacterium]
MLWVTRSKIRVNRAATGWLVRRFIDPGASFRFVEAADVAGFQVAHGAIGFDAPGARYPHQDGRGRCSFEVLVEEHRPEDGALRELAGIVHWADFPPETTAGRTQQPSPGVGTWDTLSLVAGIRSVCPTPVAPLEAVGLRAIACGFPLVAANDQEALERSAFLYDALYASLRGRSDA